jgi:hypothetical protein
VSREENVGRQGFFDGFLSRLGVYLIFFGARHGLGRRSFQRGERASCEVFRNVPRERTWNVQLGAFRVGGLSIWCVCFFQGFSRGFCCVFLKGVSRGAGGCWLSWKGRNGCRRKAQKIPMRRERPFYSIK